MATFIACCVAATIPESHKATQATTAPSDINLTELASRHPLPNISVHQTTARALSSRAFYNVPDLPAGWKAVYAVTEAVVPIALSAKHLREFYKQVALAAVNLDDRWQWTIRMGQLALVFTSRNRRQPNVTRDLILATIVMLNEFTKAGFADLFSATLWHEVDGLAVDIQFRVLARAVEGTKVT
ncbi:MAG: hypothetical protein LQ338_008172 [Usnochroma carphineum]|nr:MAG: hypothetical protein LQ338_008172 [Usnochroma carphineum]